MCFAKVYIGVAQLADHHVSANVSQMIWGFFQHSDPIKKKKKVSLQCNLQVIWFPEILKAEVLLFLISAEVLTKHPIPISRKNKSQTLLNCHNIAKHGNKTAYNSL